MKALDIAISWSLDLSKMLYNRESGVGVGHSRPLRFRLDKCLSTHIEDVRGSFTDTS